MTAEPDDLIDRAGLRTVEEHANWREVYAALDVDTKQHGRRRRDQDVRFDVSEVGE